MFFCYDINQTIPVLCETRNNFFHKILGEHRLLFVTFSKREATLTYSSSTRRTGFYFFKWAVEPSVRTRVLLASLTRKVTQNRCQGNTPFYCNQTSFTFLFLSFLHTFGILVRKKKFVPLFVYISVR